MVWNNLDLTHLKPSFFGVRMINYTIKVCFYRGETIL